MSLFSIDDEVKAMRARLTETLDKLDVFISEGTELVREVRQEIAAVRRGREAAGSQSVRVTPRSET